MNVQQFLVVIARRLLDFSLCYCVNFRLLKLDICVKFIIHVVYSHGPALDLFAKFQPKSGKSIAVYGIKDERGSTCNVSKVNHYFYFLSREYVYVLCKHSDLPVAG